MASALVLCVSAGIIDNKMSAAVTGLVAALLTLYAAFWVRVPKRPNRKVKVTKYGGSE